MKELDVLLERFLDSGFDELDAPGLEAFAAALEHPDQDLLAWLTGASAPPDRALHAIVEAVRARVVGRRV